MQTMIYKILHSNLKIKQHETHRTVWTSEKYVVHPSDLSIMYRLSTIVKPVIWYNSSITNTTHCERSKIVITNKYIHDRVLFWFGIITSINRVKYWTILMDDNLTSKLYKYTEGKRKRRINILGDLILFIRMIFFSISIYRISGFFSRRDFFAIFSQNQQVNFSLCFIFAYWQNLR